MADGLPRAVVRDQIPMSDEGLKRALPKRLTPADWYELLNAKAFFWLSEKRLHRLTNAKAYRDREHDVLEIDTKSLIDAHREAIWLCPINSGCTKPMPHPRDETAFARIPEYPYAHWRKRRGRGERVVELAIDHSVADIRNHIKRVVVKRGNAAARDLWAQIFERAAAEPNATLHEPDIEGEVAQRELVVHALKEAGWSNAEIEQRSGSPPLHLDFNVVNSPGVGPGLEHHLKFLSDRVRRVIAATSETSHEKVEIAIDPKAGVSASLTNVIMTDQGILSVSSFLFRWCGLIARAYTRTLYADIAHWTSKHSTPSSDREVLQKNVDLMLYWFRIFMSFSGTGTHALVPFRPSTPTEVHLFEQVAWAMEYFTVAHEFGHHVLVHRNVDVDLKTQEFQADAFAARVCEQLEFEPFPHLSNPYNRTGAGGSLMLLALEILERFDTPAFKTVRSANTHPSAIDRVAKISARNLMQPKQLDMDQDFNNTVSRVMAAVAAVMQNLRNAGGDEFVTMIRQQIADTEIEIRKSGQLNNSTFR